MKSSQLFKLLLICFAVALAGSAFAVNGAQKGNVQIFDPVQVNGTQLPAGNYVARWEGTGDNVKVDIVHNGKVVATTQGKVVDLGQKASEDATEVANGPNGSRELTTLRFSGKTIQINLGNPSAQAHGMK